MIEFQSFLEDMGNKQENNVLYFNDQNAIHFANNSSFYAKMKHIQTKNHFIQSLLKDKSIRLENIHGNENLANTLNKMVTIDKRKSCSTSISLQTNKKRDVLLCLILCERCN